MSFGMRRPFNKSTGRDYKKEYAQYQGTREQKLNRADRNGARRELTREGVVKKGDGKDVDHKKPMRDGGTNDRKNLRALPKSRNRGFARTSKNNPIGSA
jgi:hypothetical protein